MTVEATAPVTTPYPVGSVVDVHDLDGNVMVRKAHIETLLYDDEIAMVTFGRANHMIVSTRLLCPPANVVLHRGAHKLPRQAQALGRDLDAERIARFPGRVAMGYRLTPEQVQNRRDGRDAGLPYEVLIYQPDAAAMSWTAFYTVPAFRDWCAAYDIAVTGTLAPGESFSITLPQTSDGMAPLVATDEKAGI